MCRKYFILFFLFFLELTILMQNLMLRLVCNIERFLFWRNTFEKNPDTSIYPASMTKIMTSIIAFDLIKSGDLSFDDKFIISEKANETICFWFFLNVYYGR